MRILIINSVCGTGSTGRICIDLAKQFIEEGHEVVIAYGRGTAPEQYCDISKRIGNDLNVYSHILTTRLLDAHGFGSKMVTGKFLKWADEYNPELLWLHNIHGYYINIEMLFDWIKSRSQMKVRWTLHDCWTFTGHCSYFTAVHCDQWESQCSHCSQLNMYPRCLFRGNVSSNYERKKKAFTGVHNMELIVPSHWLERLVNKSFLKEYPVKVVYNEIDKTIFKPTPSNFREKYGIQDKKIILGVANVWDKRKGLDDFLQLTQMLDDNYVIVLVGLSEKQMRKMPKSIRCLTRTDSKEELAKIYTAADVYVNTSQEETFGMTTIEALSCGTDVVFYKDTACEEVVSKYGGIAISPDINELYKCITGHEYSERGGMTETVHY